MCDVAETFSDILQGVMTFNTTTAPSLPVKNPKKQNLPQTFHCPHQSTTKMESIYWLIAHTLVFTTREHERVQTFNEGWLFLINKTLCNYFLTNTHENQTLPIVINYFIKCMFADILGNNYTNYSL